MSTVNSVWLASLISMLAMGAVAALFGVSSWGAGLTVLFVGVGPIFIARHFWSAPEPSLSQSIQRELR